jgi:hypothetical protein
VNRIKRKRSQELGQNLTQKRAFRNWHYLMTVDRTKPVTPLAVAINHYHTVLSSKILTAWYLLIRERGKYVRFCNKIFHIWKLWAPKEKQLRLKNNEALEWLRLYRVRRSFNRMIQICYRVIGARTEKIKELRKNFCDRKLVISAYALMNMNEHVIYVDCWRKLKYYWQCKRNWKILNMQLTYSWHTQRAKSKL